MLLWLPYSEQTALASSKWHRPRHPVSLPAMAIDREHRVVLFRIPRLYRPSMSADEVSQATRRRTTRELGASARATPRCR